MDALGEILAREVSNLPFDTLDVISTQFERVRAACEAEGRDPATLATSYLASVIVAESEDEAKHTAWTTERRTA